jgi:hypothetical protein
MPCERAEQPLSHSALEDTGAPAPMEIMMAGPLEDICLLAGSPQSQGIRGGPGAAPSRGDMWQPRSCPEQGAGARAAGTCGGPGAALSQDRELEPWGHMAAPELPSARRREPLS